MKEDLIVRGKIAFSKSGRDTGKCFMIYDIINSDYVYIVDGDLRKLANPKKKNVKHLVLRSFILDGIREKLLKGETIFDSDIRLEIENYLNSQK